MKRGTIYLAAALGLAWGAVAQGAQTLTQAFAEHLTFEANAYDSSTGNWEIINTNTAPSGFNPLPAATNVHNGNGLINAPHAGPGAGTVTYSLTFIEEGTYNLFTRYSMAERGVATTNYGNEDSFFHAPGFGAPITDFSGGSPSRENLATQGHNPATNPNEGEFFYWENSTGGGTFTAPAGTTALNPFTTTFEIANREGGVILDRFAFVRNDVAVTLAGGLSAQLDGLTSIPEPSRALLLAMGLVAFSLRRKR